MNKKIITKLNDEELEAVCGGGKDDFVKAFHAEAGKQLFLLLAAPVVVGAAVGMADLVHWAMGKATQKLDKKLSNR